MREHEEELKAVTVIGIVKMFAQAEMSIKLRFRGILTGISVWILL
jgi:hypothetical protein